MGCGFESHLAHHKKSQLAGTFYRLAEGGAQFINVFDNEKVLALAQ